MNSLRSGKTKKGIILLILLLQVLILAVLSIQILRREQSPVVIEAPLDCFYSMYAPVDPSSGCLSISEDLLPASLQEIIDSGVEEMSTDKERITAFFGPFVTLEAGSYRITVDYQTDEVQYAKAAVRYQKDPAFLMSGTVLLAPERNRVVFDAFALDRIKEFMVNFEYTGKGSLKISRVTIQSSAVLQHLLRLILGSLFLLVDVCWAKRSKLKKHRNTVLSLAGMILLTSVPLTMGFLGYGHDQIYHLWRIESVADELARGIFPVRMNSMLLNGMGYPSSIFYCDLLIYIPAVFRLMGCPVAMAYQLYILLINVMTVVISYFCFRPILKQNQAVLLATLVWSTCVYRLCNLYTRAAVGEFTAMVFLPMIMLALWHIYAEKEFSVSRETCLIALGMSGVLQSHLISTVMVALVLLIFVIMQWRRTVQRRVLLTWLLAAAGTILLSAWYLVPLLQYYIAVPTKVTAAQPYANLIQSCGAWVSDLFNFFRNPYQWNEATIAITNRPNVMTPGVLLMAALGIGIWLWIDRKASREMRVLTVLGLITLLFSTNLFPWDLLASHSSLFSIHNSIQFPWRYISIAALILSLQLGLIWLKWQQEKKKWLPQVTVCLVAVAVLTSCIYFGFYNDFTDRRDYFSTADLPNTREALCAAEYQRATVRGLPLQEEKYPDYVLYEPVRGKAEWELLERNGSDLLLHCSAEEESTLDIPVYHYPGYRVTDEAGKEYEITDSDELTMRIVLPAGFCGVLQVCFCPPALWHMAEWVSLAALLIVVLVSLRRNRKNAALSDHSLLQ